MKKYIPGLVILGCLAWYYAPVDWYQRLFPPKAIASIDYNNGNPRFVETDKTPIPTTPSLALRFDMAAEQVLLLEEQIKIALELIEKTRYAIYPHAKEIRRAVLEKKLPPFDSADLAYLRKPEPSSADLVALYAAYESGAAAVAFHAEVGAEFTKEALKTDLRLAQGRLVSSDLRNADVLVLQTLQKTCKERLRAVTIAAARVDAIIAKCATVSIPSQPDPHLAPMSELFPKAAEGATWPLEPPTIFTVEDASGSESAPVKKPTKK